MSISSTAPWLHFYGDMPHHLEYPDLTLYQIVSKTANAHPHQCAFEFLGRKTDYQTFSARIERAAKALYAAGIRQGERVSICMPNTPQALECFYALNRIGAVSNMIHPLSAKQEIVYYLNVSKSKAILTLDRFYEKVHGAIEDTNAKPMLWIAKLEDEMPLYLRIGFRFTEAKKYPKLPKDGSYTLWSTLIKNGETALAKEEPNAQDCACILYSGGTTGTSKGICLSSANLNALALQTIAASGYKDITGMSMLSIMPIFHGFGLGVGIHTPFVGGAKCILVPNFSIKTYAKLLRTKKPNFIPGVPTLFEALLRAEKLEGLDMSFLRGVFCGGDSLSIELKNKVDAFLQEHHSPVQIREGYGTTECVTASCLTPIHNAREGSIGIPYPDTYYKIVAVNTTDECEAGTDGEICLRGPSVMMGYLDNPEETALVLKKHGDGFTWLHTGDLGYMDADGFVYFKQRIKRMIITSGYNVYPSQLENIIEGHEKVLLSCVIGVKDPYKIQRIKAFVVLHPQYEPTEALRQELFAYCSERIAKYAMPREIEFRKELPKTSVGKIAYRVLQEEEEKKQ